MEKKDLSLSVTLIDVYCSISLYCSNSTSGYFSTNNGKASAKSVRFPTGSGNGIYPPLKWTNLFCNFILIAPGLFNSSSFNVIKKGTPNNIAFL
ncbi:hypothetical protein WN66_03361 [Saccharomyces cerevisiae]|uniref:Uncharacterized protein YJL197C-A n=2 Tax=Saccharomyces cerevisiae TaxID=4932 RepID=YJ197_YEAST|nr:RecName: Full=Uncharacterized protein YJL197C-A [Saccharomyces cerevisiae S288C]KZV10078.1 hypothetical protein WN66_03361 [Saccharomyces cerevisiae]WNV73201.1 hypothetical protein O6U65_1102 [Saccharomyces cerevisiae synthetic construct]CAY80590.2 EC1118_1J11_0364p [Saccharomyces cerevisiae EC1118]